MFDAQSAIIVLGIIALIALPFFLNSFFKKSKELKFLKEFSNLAEKEKVVISQKELWRNCYAIGIDNNSRKILYMNKRKDNSENISIDLSEVEKCRIVNINKTVKNYDGRSNLSDRIELVFTLRKSDLPEKVLEFYDNAEFMPTENDQSHAENWLQIITSNLKSGKK
jgi:hypothetical protein